MVYGVGAVHNDAILTNISVAYPNNGMVGERLFPVVKVKKQSDKYYVLGRESWVAETSDYRAPGAIANEIEGLQTSFDSYYAAEHSLQIPITDEERENADSPLSPDSDGVNLVTAKILLSREVAMQQMVTNTANFASDHSVTLSGTSQWSDYVNSDPITVIRTAVRKIHSKIFMEPNVAVIPYQVMSILEDHPKIIARIQYTDRAILTPEIIGAVLGLPNIIVPGIAIGTITGATSNFNMTASYLWGKDVLIAYVAPSPGLKVATLAYEFVWGYNGSPQTVDRWREEVRKSDVIRVSRRYDLKMIGVETNPGSADVNKVVMGYLIKNAIA